jgi:hypothetical protein
MVDEDMVFAGAKIIKSLAWIPLRMSERAALKTRSRNLARRR